MKSLIIYCFVGSNKVKFMYSQSRPKLSPNILSTCELYETRSHCEIVLTQLSILDVSDVWLPTLIPIFAAELIREFCDKKSYFYSERLPKQGQAVIPCTQKSNHDLSYFAKIFRNPQILDPG